MCLTAEALALFLNLLSPAIIDSAPGRITLTSTEPHTHWVPVEDKWCTDAPQIDRMARFPDLRVD